MSEGQPEREDSWAAAAYSDEEKKEKEKQDAQKQTRQSIPRRPERTKTPRIDDRPPKKYIQMFNSNEVPEYEVVNAPSAVRTEKVNPEGSDENTKPSKPPSDGSPSYHAPSKYPRAKVFTLADRGPNLNTKSTRRTQQEEAIDYEWSLPPTPPPPIRLPGSGPPSYGGTPEPETPRDVFNPTDEEKDKAAKEYDEEIKKINESDWDGKPLTKWVGNVTVKTTQRAMYGENTEQVQEAIKVVNTLTDAPLNKFFSRLTTLLPSIIFFISLIASLIDIIITQAENAAYGITCFLLDCIEVVLLLITFLIHKSSWYKGKTEDARVDFDKKKQIADNILTEVVLYPTILCSVIGIATSTPFFPENIVKMDHEGHIGRLDMFLITFDIIILLYVYGSRIFIVKKFMANLSKLLSESEDSYFGISSRIFFAIVLNAVLFIVMIVLLGLQIYNENKDENKPEWIRQKENETEEQLVYISGVTAYMLVSSVIVPILSIIVFILANYYYILELMIKVNIHIVQNSQMRENLEKNYGQVAENIMGFAKKNVHATPGRLRDIQSLNTFQRVFYVLREWWIDLIFFIWAVIIILYCYLFYSNYGSNYLTTTFEMAYFSAFVICLCIFTLANYHSFTIVMTTNIIIVPLLFSFAGQSFIDNIKKFVRRKKAAPLESTDTSQKTPLGDPEKKETLLLAEEAQRAPSRKTTTPLEVALADKNNAEEFLPGSMPTNGS